MRNKEFSLFFAFSAFLEENLGVGDLLGLLACLLAGCLADWRAQHRRANNAIGQRWPLAGQGQIVPFMSLTGGGLKTTVFNENRGPIGVDPLRSTETCSLTLQPSRSV